MPGVGLAHDSEHRGFSCILAPVLMLFFLHIFMHIFMVLVGMFISAPTQKLGNLVARLCSFSLL